MTPNDSHPGHAHPARAAAGMDVLDRDGVQLGVVGETFGGVFRLTTADGVDHWLGYDLVSALAETTVVLRISHAELPQKAADQVGSQRYVLIVDDDPLIRGVLAEAISSRGVRVLTANDGEEGLRALSEIIRGFVRAA